MIVFKKKTTQKLNLDNIFQINSLILLNKNREKNIVSWFLIKNK
jgi:hypothetical protein